MNTVFLATAIGWYSIIISAFILLRADQFKAVATDILGNRGLFFTFTLFTYIIALLLVLNHNIWVNHWTVAITIFSWALLLTTLFRLFNMDFVIKKGKSILKHPHALKVPGIISLIFGLYLLFHVY